MPIQVSFIVADNEHQDLLAFACQQAAALYRQQQKVFIFTEDEAQAHQIDELLWTFETDSFVPHNLVGEGPKFGAPVEISWQAPTNRRSALINLTSNVPNFVNQYQHIIDFVPHDETLKALARERYRVYKSYGYVVETQQLAESV